MASNAHIGRFSKAVFSSRSIVRHGNRSFEAEVLYQDPDSSITRNHAYFLLQRCEENNDLEYGRQLRSLLFLNGLDSVAVLEDHLIRLFAYHESLPEANEAFGQVSKPTPFTWTAIIMANAKLGQGKAALELYHQMQASGSTGNTHIYVAVLKACTITSTSEGRIIHDQIKSSIQSDVVLGNTLIDMYAKCGNLAEASETLKKLPLRDVVSWNTMIAGYAQQGELSVALECFKSMRQEGVRPNVISWGAIINGYAQCGEGVLALKCFIDMQQECIRPDLITFLGALKACASVQAVVQGIVIHSHIMRGGYQFNVVLGTSLIDMYAKCGRLKDALQVFNMLPDPNVVSWGAVIAGYAQHGDYVRALHYFEIMQQEGVRPNVVLWNLIIAGCAHHGEHDLALLCFQKMLHEGIKPNRATFAAALKACACTGAMNLGRLFHGQIIIFRYPLDVVISSTLIEMYAKCWSLEEACKVFSNFPYQHVLTWNAMLAGYVLHGNGFLALDCFTKLEKEGQKPNEVTFSSTLAACASIGALHEGRLVHGQIIESGLQIDDVMENTLVDLYAKCGSLDEAQKFFKALLGQKLQTWNSIIAAYADNGSLGIEFFEQMHHEGIKPNKVTFLSTVRACISMGVIQQGRVVHEEIIMEELHSDIFVANTLLNMYAKLGSVEEAQKVFRALPSPDVVSWSAMIAGYLQQEQLTFALDSLLEMQWQGINPNMVTLSIISNACGNMKAIPQGRLINAQIIEKKLQLNSAIENSLIYMYASSGCLEEASNIFYKSQIREIMSWSWMIAGFSRSNEGIVARKYFEMMRQEGFKPNLIAWNALITCFVQHGEVFLALNLFYKMQEFGIKPNTVSYKSTLYACVKKEAIEEGKLIHGKLIDGGLQLAIMGDSLLHLYAKCGNVAVARKVFDDMSDEDVVTVVSWNAIICGYARAGEGNLALVCFQKMQEAGIEPDSMTYLAILKACISICALEKGRVVHEDVIQRHVKSDAVENTLIYMYARCGGLEEAKSLFCRLPNRDEVTWGAMIAGYTQQGEEVLALECFYNMQHEKIGPTKITFLSALKACACINLVEHGRLIHEQVIEHGFELCVVLGSSLANMYAKCRSLEEAENVFNYLQNQNVVSWNAIIAGYAENREGTMALQWFDKMQQEGINPSKATYLSILKACARMGAIEHGRLIHHEICTMGLQSDVTMSNSLIDMYAKCGSLEEAYKIFSGITYQNVVSWAAIIGAYTMHGEGCLALQCSEKMQLEGINPDEVSLFGILKACASLGAIEQGRVNHDKAMESGLQSHTIANTLVDMYAKCGSLKEADSVFHKLPGKNVVSWAAMIAGYAQQGKGLLALKCFEQMQEEGIKEDDVALLNVLKACASVGAIEQGMLVHDKVSKRGLEIDIVMGCTLVDMYAKCGDLEEAGKVFLSLPNRNLVSWSAIIAAHGQHGNCLLALECFERMQQERIQPDETTFTNILVACSRVGLGDEGRWYLRSMQACHQIAPSPSHYACLVDILGRAGCFVEAENLLLFSRQENIVGWTSLLSACRMHGNVEVGRRCFCHIATMDSSGCVGGYVLMSNMYADYSQMILAT